MVSDYAPGLDAQVSFTRAYTEAGRFAPADKPEIEAIVGKVRDKNYGFRSLVHEIVQSRVFLNK
jgi:hypothetical protein